MEAATIAQLKKALGELDRVQLLDTCLRLARFKKDNKELLTYLLFLSNDEPAYADYLCDQIDEQFADSPNAHKKTLRKIVRWMDKCLRFSKVKETEADVRIHFCLALRASRTPFRANRVMANMYFGQLKKIAKAIEKLHSDVRAEYQAQLDALGH